MPRQRISYMRHERHFSCEHKNSKSSLVTESAMAMASMRLEESNIKQYANATIQQQFSHRLDDIKIQKLMKRTHDTPIHSKTGGRCNQTTYNSTALLINEDIQPISCHHIDAMSHYTNKITDEALIIVETLRITVKNHFKQSKKSFYTKFSNKISNNTYKTISQQNPRFNQNYTPLFIRSISEFQNPSRNSSKTPKFNSECIQTPKAKHTSLWIKTQELKQKMLSRQSMNQTPFSFSNKKSNRDQIKSTHPKLSLAKHLSVSPLPFLYRCLPLAITKSTSKGTPMQKLSNRCFIAVNKFEKCTP